MTDTSHPCELCAAAGGALLWRNPLCRIVSVGDPDYPGFCRVILNRHAAEMSDLSSDEQQELMRIVFAVEAVVRDVVKPDKINLASLGNLVPHVHWHVIPRWREDRCFPNPIWAPAQRTAPAIPVAHGPVLVASLATELVKRLGPPLTLDGSRP
ncbi:MAG: HIT family protein [Propionivibrio sp.]